MKREIGMLTLCTGKIVCFERLVRSANDIKFGDGL